MRHLSKVGMVLLVLFFSNALAYHSGYHPYGECLAEGTMITLADGTELKIEAVIQEDTLFSWNGSGLQSLAYSDLNLVLYSFVIGNLNEKHSTNHNHLYTSVASSEMYKLVDTAGRELIATGDHPVITRERGIVPLSELKTGDTLFVLGGTSNVASVKVTPYVGDTYNIGLDSPSSLVSTSKSGEIALDTLKAHTMFANGILVGDMYLQVYGTSVSITQR